MQWQRLWRIMLTASILVGLWWWTVVSVGAEFNSAQVGAPTPIELSQIR